APALPLDPPAPPGCHLPPLPDGTAAAAHGAALAIAVGPKSGADRLDWRWHRGAPATTDFGDPTATTDYRLCLYDGTSTLIASALAPAGARCGRKPCWSATRTGFHYADARAATGVADVTLAGTGGTTCKLAGKGASVGVPTLPASTPLTAQLVNGDGTCWTATFSSPRKRTSHLLKAVSD